MRLAPLAKCADKSITRNWLWVKLVTSSPTAALLPAVMRTLSQQLVKKPIGKRVLKTDNYSEVHQLVCCDWRAMFCKTDLSGDSMNAPLPSHLLPEIAQRETPAAFIDALKQRFADRCSTALVVREQHGRRRS